MNFLSIKATNGINHLISQSSSISSPVFHNIQQKDAKRETSEVQGAATKTPTWILFKTSSLLYPVGKAAYVTQKALSSHAVVQKDSWGKERLIKRREKEEMESGFVKIHLTCNTNTVLLNLSILTQCYFLSRFSCDVYLTGWFGWLFFVGFVWFGFLFVVSCGCCFFLVGGWLVFGLGFFFVVVVFGGVLCWFFLKDNQQIQFQEIHSEYKSATWFEF